VSSARLHHAGGGATVGKLYQHWRRAQRADNLDAYVHGILAHTWLDERRRPWRREHAVPDIPDRPAQAGSAGMDPSTRRGDHPDQRQRGRATEAARHPVGRPGVPEIRDEHYPARNNPLDRQPKAVTAQEAAFLTIGDGAAAWLLEAAAAGTNRIRSKMADAVALAKLHGADTVDRALGTAAPAGRFPDNDLRSIVDHRVGLGRQDSQRVQRPRTRGMDIVDQFHTMELREASRDRRKYRSAKPAKYRGSAASMSRTWR
jgi:DNA-directed RNA polymerase specialized sigma24 family protein